jgi:hypothetical protein
MNSTTTSPLVLLASRYLVFGLIALPFALFLLAQP